MSLRDLLPGQKSGHSFWGDVEDSMASVQNEINRVFESFSGKGSGALWDPRGGFMPRINVSEGKSKIKISGEFPGMDESDIDITATDQALVIRGEKKTESEDKDDDHHLVERSYGSFRRVIPLPDGVEKDKIEATFKKGVLRIEVPYNPAVEAGKKQIPIKNA